ncbi:hypothetical protein FrEUN1fDRAFT_1993 [Parafrankia sp. EUN1f]|nr:hypothetical protein FrEUN1fDRAFT_1993 [Parafrankia sp. EUN1f]
MPAARRGLVPVCPSVTFLKTPPTARGTSPMGAAWGDAERGAAPFAARSVRAATGMAGRADSIAT